MTDMKNQEARGGNARRGSVHEMLADAQQLEEWADSRGDMDYGEADRAWEHAFEVAEATLDGREYDDVMASFGWTKTLRDEAMDDRQSGVVEVDGSDARRAADPLAKPARRDQRTPNNDVALDGRRVGVAPDIRRALNEARAHYQNALGQQGDSLSRRSGDALDIGGHWESGIVYRDGRVETFDHHQDYEDALEEIRGAMDRGVGAGAIPATEREGLAKVMNDLDDGESFEAAVGGHVFFVGEIGHRQDVEIHVDRGVHY